MNQCFKFMQVHKNEEDLSISLAKEAKLVFSSLHNRYTKNNKGQKNAKFSNHCYYVQDINDFQYKNSNISWDYQKFPRHPVAAEKL